MFAMIEKDFRTGPTGTSIPHRPEIVGSGNPDNPVVRQTGNFLPQSGRLIILVIDRHQ